MCKHALTSLGQGDPLEKGMATPSPVFLPGESHGWRSLVGYGPRGCKESDMTERLHFHFVSHSTFLTIDSKSHFCVTALAAAAAKSLQSCPTL